MCLSVHLVPIVAIDAVVAVVVVCRFFRLYLPPVRGTDEEHAGDAVNEDKRCSCVGRHHLQLQSTGKAEEQEQEEQDAKGPPHGSTLLHYVYQGNTECKTPP